MIKRIGILTAGSDCPGLNAAIRAVGKTTQQLGVQLIAFQDGFQGLVGDRTVDIETFSGILTTGGTILGTSRDIPQAMRDKSQGCCDQTDEAVAVYKRHKLDGLICIGGRETQEGALALAAKGLSVVTLPKAIDNDVAETEQTIGFSTAVEVAAQSIDRLHSTAYSNHRIIIVEIMGRNTGWLTLGSGIAAGADVILIPEIPYNLEKVSQAVLDRRKKGKRFSILAVSEYVTSQEHIAFTERLRKLNARRSDEEDRQGVDDRLLKLQGDRHDTTHHVSNQLKTLTGLETRITILGYLLRGGAPSGADRILATMLATAGVDSLYNKKGGVMMAARGDKIVPVPLEKVATQHNPVPLGHPWLDAARQVGTYLGD